MMYASYDHEDSIGFKIIPRALLYTLIQGFAASGFVLPSVMLSLYYSISLVKRPADILSTNDPFRSLHRLTIPPSTNNV